MVKKIKKYKDCYYVLKIGTKEMYTIEHALTHALRYLDKIFKFAKNNKNRKLYTISYEYYKRYKKLEKKIKLLFMEKKKDE